MQLEQLAVLFVFVGNAASITMLAFMLYRIVKQTEATHKMLSGGAQDLLDAGKRLRESMQSTDRLVDRLTDINANADLSQGSAPSGSEADEQFRKIQNMLQDLSGNKVKDQGRFLEDIKGLLDSISSTPAGDMAQWRDANANRVETAQAQRNRMATEVENLRARLDEANRMIQELRRSVRLAESATQTTDNLQAKLDQQQQLLARAKERAQAAEARSATLSREIELMQATGSESSGRDSGASQALRRQLEEVSKERDALKGQLERTKEAMQRTLIEKDFIEEKLLDLDAAIPPSSDQAAGAPGGAPAPSHPV